MVDNRLRIQLQSMPVEAVERLRELFTHSNPAHFKLKKMGFKAWKEPAVIKTWQDERDENGDEWMTLPRGGTERLRAVFNEFDVRLKFLDLRTEGDDKLLGGSELPKHNVDLWEHQHRIVDAAITVQNCVVRSAAGSGKTTALLAALSRVGLPAIVIVWETGLMRQWMERIEKELGLNRDEIGIVGKGEFKLRPITLAMQQSLNRLNASRWNAVNAAFGFVGADELNRFAASTFRKTIDRFSAKYRIGMSAEEKRKDGKEFLIYDMFGNVGVDVGAAELVETGIVHDVEVRIVPTEFRADWYVAQRESNRVPDFNALLEAMRNDKQRNELIVSVTARATDNRRKALVFSHRVEHCRRLDSVFAGYGMRSGVMVGEDAARYEETVRGLRSGQVQIGIGTFGKIGLGLDLPAVAAGIIATPCHNNRPLWIQVTGRISRTAEGKTDAVLWYLWDKHVHGTYPLNNLRRWSRNVSVEFDGEWIAVNDYLEMMKNQRAEG